MLPNIAFVLNPKHLSRGDFLHLANKNKALAVLLQKTCFGYMPWWKWSSHHRIKLFHHVNILFLPIIPQTFVVRGTYVNRIHHFNSSSHCISHLQTSSLWRIQTFILIKFSCNRITLAFPGALLLRKPPIFPQRDFIFVKKRVTNSPDFTSPYFFLHRDRL